MHWFLDFVGFQFPNVGFIIKEITILSGDGDRCYNYFITGPEYINIENYKTYNYQYDLHRLRWEFGDYEYCEAMLDIASKLRCDPVYIKGREKYNFISSQFAKPNFIELTYIPSYKLLNNCVHERCEVKHGNHCARRKAYELRHAYQDLSREKQNAETFHQL